MSALTGKPLKGLQSFAPMLHAKGKCIYIYTHKQKVLKKHLFSKLFRFLYRSIVNIIKIQGNIKQKLTQQLIINTN